MTDITNIPARVKVGDVVRIRNTQPLQNTTFNVVTVFDGRAVVQAATGRSKPFHTMIENLEVVL